MIEVHYRPAHSHTPIKVLELAQVTKDAPMGGASLRDLDGDGEYEVEARGGCGAGPNCEGQIYRLTRDKQSMFAFFVGGYAELSYIAGSVVESGRASCCAWEHHVYSVKSKHSAIEASDQTYRVVVGLPVDTDDPKSANCVFYDNQKRVTLPMKQKLLKLCEVYGRDYLLAAPRRK